MNPNPPPWAMEKAAEICARYVLPYGYSAQEMQLGIAQALADEREKAALIASCAFRNIYNGEDEHAKMCYLKILKAIRKGGV